MTQKALNLTFKDFSVILLEETSDGQEKIVYPTYKIAFKFWWAHFCRSMILITATALVIVLPVAFYCGFNGIPLPETMLNVFGVLAEFFASIYVIKKILNKKFKTFSICTVANTTDTTEI